MYCKAKHCRNSIVIISVMIILGFSQPAFSQDSYLLEINIDDVIACPGQQNVEIPIYLRNYADTVAGFSLWLHLSRPDIMEFQTTFKTIEYDVYYIYTEWHSQNPEIPVDSVVASLCWVCNEWDGDECIESSSQLGYYKCSAWSFDGYCLDSVFVPWVEGVDVVHTESVEVYVGHFDTTGTLTSGWEMVTTRSLIGNGLDILITAFANQTALPPDDYTPGIGFPQMGYLPLIKIIVDVYPLDDGIIDRDVTIIVESDFIDNFNLSNERGKSLGVISAEVENTEYYMCEQWMDPPYENECFFWNRVAEYDCPPEGCDSTFVDTIMHTFLDVDRCCDPSSGICDNNVMESECPDEFNGTGIWHDGSISITDGSLHVNLCLCGDFDNDQTINILDVVFLINFLYKEGKPPEPLITGDTDGDGEVNILDIVCLLNRIYKGIDCFNCDWLR